MSVSLSIIILTCNQRDYTLRCIDSLSDLVRQRKDIEIVLVDNGSTDKTIESIKAKDYYSEEYLRIIRSEQNIGVAPGRNLGISNARTEKYLMILDNDTVATAGAVLSLIEYMENNRTVGLAAPMLKSPAGQIQSSFKPYPGIGEKIRNVVHDRSVIENPPQNVIHPFYVIGACQIMRKTVIDKIGLLDDRIFFGPEDADYCIRVRNAGFSVDYIPYISIIHDWQRVSSRKPFSATSLKHIAGLLYFYRKYRRLF